MFIKCCRDFAGLLLVFVGIMPDKVILDHRKSYLVSFENFHFFRFLAKTDNKQTLIPEKIQVSGTSAVPNISDIQVSGSGKN